MKFNWQQTGMPASLLDRPARRNEFAEFKAVLNDAGNHVMRPVDAEAMAREFADAGGREFVEMVRELTTELANAKRELESANRRCERLAAELSRRGIDVTDEAASPREPGPAAEAAPEAPVPSVDGLAEWEEWNRRFESLLG